MRATWLRTVATDSHSSCAMRSVTGPRRPSRGSAAGAASAGARRSAARPVPRRPRERVARRRRRTGRSPRPRPAWRGGTPPPDAGARLLVLEAQAAGLLDRQPRPATRVERGVAGPRCGALRAGRGVQRVPDVARHVLQALPVHVGPSSVVRASRASMRALLLRTDRGARGTPRGAGSVAAAALYARRPDDAGAPHPRRHRRGDSTRRRSRACELPWAFFALALLPPVLGGDRRGRGLAGAGEPLHEWVHDGRHLLGFPCH